jgi:thioredoxin-dependent peroxiredoxin
MKKNLSLLVSFAALFAAISPAFAALKPGAKAPPIVAAAALGGKAYEYNLAKSLKRGPVVLYFFPAAFTQGCTLETREFVENHAAFVKAGATVVGISTDTIDTLKRFSVEECRSTFPVVAASAAIVKGYDAQLPLARVANRISYVIAPNGQVVYAHSDLDYRKHVALTLKAVQGLKAARK